jgi:hypothetical protein
MLIATFSVVPNKTIGLRELQFLKKRKATAGEDRNARLRIPGKPEVYARVGVLRVIRIPDRRLGGSDGTQTRALLRDRYTF